MSYRPTANARSSNLPQQLQMQPMYGSYPNGYMLSLPAPGIPYQNRPMIYPNVYQHRLEEYQPSPYQPSYLDLQQLPLSNPNNFWAQSQNYHSQFTEDNYEIRINQNQHQYVGEFSQQQMKPPNKSVTAPPRQQTAGATAKRNVSFTNVPTGPTKTRRMNPPMDLLPAPKPDSNRRNHNQSVRQNPNNGAHKKNIGKPLNRERGQFSVSQQLTQKVSTSSLPYQIQLYGARVLLGTIPQLLKWNSARHKIPPVYETIGMLTKRLEMKKISGHQTEYHFILRNLAELCHNDRSSMADELKCVVFDAEDDNLNVSVDSHLRVVGRFLPSRLFHCLKVRPATESDFALLTSKLKGQNVRANSVTTSLSREKEQDKLERAKETKNPFVGENPEDSFYSLFTPF